MIKLPTKEDPVFINPIHVVSITSNYAKDAVHVVELLTGTRVEVPLEKINNVSLDKFVEAVLTARAQLDKLDE